MTETQINLQQEAQIAQTEVGKIRLDTTKAEQDAEKLERELLEAQLIEAQKKEAEKRGKETKEKIEHVTGGRL